MKPEEEYKKEQELEAEQKKNVEIHEDISEDSDNEYEPEEEPSVMREILSYMLTFAILVITIWYAGESAVEEYKEKREEAKIRRAQEQFEQLPDSEKTKLIRYLLKMGSTDDSDGEVTPVDSLTIDQ